MRIRPGILIILAAGAVSVCAGWPAQAQGRNTVRLSTLGAGSPSSTFGRSSGMSSFSQYSTSAGSLQSSISGGSGGAGQNYSFRSSGGGASPYASFSTSVSTSASSRSLRGSAGTSFSTEAADPFTSRGQRYDTGLSMSRDVGGATGISKLFSRAEPTVSGGQVFGPDESALADSTDAITSLAPEDESTYARCMRDGERAFRDRQYVTAFSKFEMAHRIGNDPESLLSMAHAKFAGGSYSACALYLRQVLRQLPQLPRARLRPRDFYGDRTAYVSDLRRLDEYMASRPGDAEIALIKAYFAWFDPDRGPMQALQAIAEGLSKPNGPQATLALEMFQESILAILQESPEPSGVRPAGPRAIP